ncbi:MAG: hypothetical protein AAFO04_18330 [Cyanobacteria bacterium J06592_8]
MTTDYKTPIPHKPTQNLGTPIGSTAPIKIQCESPNDFLYKVAKKVQENPALKQQLESRIYEMLLRDLEISRER